MHLTHNDRVRMHPSQNTEKNNCYRSLHIRQLGINGPRKLEIQADRHISKLEGRPSEAEKREEADAARPWMRITLLRETQ